MQSRVPSTVPLVEAVPIMEVFATGMIPIEHCGEYVRLTFFSEQNATDGTRERVVVCKLVIPKGAYTLMLRCMVEAPSLMM